jgi:anti-anti-sigma factor
MPGDTFAPARLDIDEQSMNGCRRIALRGDLDGAGVVALERALERAHAARPATLVVDLRRLDVLGRSGIQALVAAYGRCCHDGTVLKVLRAPDDVHRAFAVAA